MLTDRKDVGYPSLSHIIFSSLQQNLNSLQAAGLLFQLRQKWHSLFLRRMRAPSKPWSQVDETTVRAIIAVLSIEEQSAGLQQPSGIGQRPRPMTSEELPLASAWTSTSSQKSSAETECPDDSPNAEK